MCAEIIIQCVKIIIHTLNVCGNDYSHIGDGMDILCSRLSSLFKE